MPFFPAKSEKNSGLTDLGFKGLNLLEKSEKSLNTQTIHIPTIFHFFVPKILRFYSGKQSKSILLLKNCEKLLKISQFKKKINFFFLFFMLKFIFSGQFFWFGRPPAFFFELSTSMFFQPKLYSFFERIFVFALTFVLFF